MNLTNPLPITLENGPEKWNGFVMKLTSLGMMVELDKIAFKVGSYLTAHVQLNEKTIVTERVRSIKHYDKFVRKVPVGKGRPTTPPVPKMLCEVHFDHLSEGSKIAITKFLISLKAKAP